MIRPTNPLLSLAVAASLALAGCGGTATSGDAPPPAGSGATSGGTAPTAAPSEATGAQGACPTSEPPPLPAGETRTVTIATNLGTIVISVEGALSPIAAGNFVALASCGFYDGVVFHRVVPGFVIQGGDGQFGRVDTLAQGRAGTGGPGYTITDEPVTATYSRGTVAMARTSAPNSQGSQFFIVTNNEAREALAAYNTYAIFGTVTSGMEVVDLIVTAAGGVENPSLPVAMDSVTVSR